MLTSLTSVCRYGFVRRRTLSSFNMCSAESWQSQHMQVTSGTLRPDNDSDSLSVSLLTTTYMRRWMLWSFNTWRPEFPGNLSVQLQVLFATIALPCSVPIFVSADTGCVVEACMHICRSRRSRRDDCLNMLRVIIVDRHKGLWSCLYWTWTVNEVCVASASLPTVDRCRCALLTSLAFICYGPSCFALHNYLSPNFRRT